METFFPFVFCFEDQFRFPDFLSPLSSILPPRPLFVIRQGLFIQNDKIFPLFPMYFQKKTLFFLPLSCPTNLFSHPPSFFLSFCIVLSTSPLDFVTSARVDVFFPHLWGLERIPPPTKKERTAYVVIPPPPASNFPVQV